MHKVKEIDYEQILSTIENNNFDTIYLGSKVIDEDNVVEITTIDKPFCIYSSDRLSKTLFINEEFYLKNKDLVEELVSTICKYKKVEQICLDKELINKNIALSIISNSKIDYVEIGTQDKPYALTQSIYNIFKNSHIRGISTDKVADELEYNFDPKIIHNRFKSIFGDFNYFSLINARELTIRDKIKDEDIKNVKYLRDGAKLHLESDYYQNTFDIIKEINDNNYDIEVIIHIEDKNKFNEYIFNNSNDIDMSKVSVSVDHREAISYKKYIEYESRLLDMIKPAINLSPFLQYLYAYNVVKQFKKYKENTQDLQDSRNLYRILDNDYMVCVGYCNLLKDLLDKLNIPSTFYNVSVNVGFPKENNNLVTVTPNDYMAREAGHARLEVNLVDENYNIDGYFIADPTWDNSMEEDLYLHALMSREEYNQMHRENFMELFTVKEVFFVNSIEEFYKKANMWMNNRERIESRVKILKSEKVAIPKNFKELSDLDYTLELEEEKQEKRISHSIDYIKSNQLNKELKINIQYEFIKEVLDYIKELDINFYNMMINKYQSLDYSKDKEVIQNIMYDLGNYIVKKVTNTLSGKTLFTGVEYLYETIYGKSRDDLLRTINTNKEVFTTSFPIRFKIDNNGIETLMNDFNKFDVSVDNDLTM